jgi:hypothetical protein
VWPLRLDGRFARARCVFGEALSARVVFDDPYGVAVFYEYVARDVDILILEHALPPPARSGAPPRPEATVLCRMRRDGVDSTLELVVDTLAAAVAAAEPLPPAPPELSQTDFEADSDLRARFRSRLRLYA